MDAHRSSAAPCCLSIGSVHTSAVLPSRARAKQTLRSKEEFLPTVRCGCAEGAPKTARMRCLQPRLSSALRFSRSEAYQDLPPARLTARSTDVSCFRGLGPPQPIDRWSDCGPGHAPCPSELLGLEVRPVHLFWCGPTDLIWHGGLFCPSDASCLGSSVAGYFMRPFSGRQHGSRFGSTD